MDYPSGVRVYDAYSAEARDIYWNNLKRLFDFGLDGWWMDSTEPDHFDVTSKDMDTKTALGSFRRVRGAYPLMTVGGVYDHQRATSDDKRVFILTRSGWAGQQRYGCNVWTGDVTSTWDMLRNTVPALMNFSLTGNPNCNSDIGGFFCNQYNKRSGDNSAPKNPLFQELYVRWLQMGTFTPMLRTHAQLKPEPYNFPDVEPISKRYIKMRYEWLPYNYTLAYENAAKGWPLARPLDFHGDNPGEKYASIDDEYLWGDNVLVAPVMKKGARSRKVVFPAGEWVDYNNIALTYRGGTTATVKAPLEQMPLFVRKGAFIPQYTLPLENVGQYDPAHLTVQYYPSAKPSTYVLYDDDRTSPTALNDGNYMLTTFKGQSDASGTVISIDCNKNPNLIDWMPSTRNITLSIECQNRTPRSVTVESDGETLSPDRKSWKYNPRKRTLSVTVPFSGKPLTLTVK